MIKLSAFSLFVLLILAVNINAQWERIGWQGGQISIEAQLGKTLFGKAGTAFYKSTDWGKSWALFNDNLPHLNWLYDSHYISERGDYLLLGRFDLSDSEAGFYTLDDENSIWNYKQISFKGGDLVPPLINTDAGIWFLSRDSIILLSYNYTTGIHYESDGLYVTTNGGKKWEKRLEGMTIPTGGDTYYDELIKQGDTYLADTYSYDSTGNFSGYKLYKTTNFGLEWKEVNRPAPDTVAGSELISYYYSYIYRVNDSLLVFFTDDSLFFSWDKGETWSLASSPLPPRKEIQFIHLLTERNGKLFLSMRRREAFLKNEVYTSYDNGRSWLQFFPGDTSLEVHSIRGDGATYVINELGLTDSTFKKITPYGQAVGVYNGYKYLLCVDNSRLFAINYYDTIPLLISLDNGETWIKHLYHPDFYITECKWVKDGTNLYSIGGEKTSQNVYILKSSDGGGSWEKFCSTPDPFNIGLKIDTVIISHNTIILCSRYTRNIFYSTNSGSSWNNCPSPTDLSLANQNPSLAYNDGILCFGEYYTLDFGFSWTKINTYPDVSSDILNGLFVAGKNILATTGSDVYGKYILFVTQDTGIHWKKAFGGVSQDGFLKPVAFEQGLLYVVSCQNSKGYESFTDYKLYVSRDTGISWVRLGDSVMRACELFIGSDYLFLAANNELWRLPKSVLAVTKGDQYGEGNPISMGVAPNPAKDEISIAYQLPNYGKIELSAFDMLGRKIDVIVPEIEDAGKHTVQWDTRNLPTGVYYLRLTAGRVVTNKIVYIIK